MRLQLFTAGSQIANTKRRTFNAFRRWAMLGELMNIPTDTLMDMICVILAGGAVLSPSDVAELGQIQCELQRRIDNESWLRRVN